MSDTANTPQDDTALSILRAVNLTFEKYLLPSLKDDKVSVYAGLVLRALQYLEHRQFSFGSAEQTHAARSAELVQNGAKLSAGAGSYAELIHTALATANQNGDAGDRARHLLRAIAENEFSYFAALDHESHTGGGGSHRGGRADQKAPEDEEPLNLEALGRWAREVWGRDKEVIDLVPLPGGFSKTTALVTVKDATGERQYVLRRDLPIPLIEQSVVEEYPLLVQLHADGFEVAKPVCLEPRKEFVGGAFMLSERLFGVSDFAVWKDDPERVRKIAWQFAALLARLHAYELTPERRRKMGLPLEELTAYEAMQREIQDWYDLYRRKMKTEQPLLELAFTWLMANIPQALKARRACLLHGDAGWHNLLVDQAGNIAAMLDWEFHHLGDVEEEIQYARMYVEQVMDWDEFLSFYTQAGGTAHTDNTAFYSVWADVRNCIGCVDSVALFESILPNELKLAVAGYVFGPRLQVAAAKKVLTAIEAATRR
jgi:aminoglycoside phosphotransferase (APT) family kinase protein